MSEKTQEEMEGLGIGSTMENTEGRIQNYGDSRMGQWDRKPLLTVRIRVFPL